ncbi:STAS domain-containing protein [Micromonospora sp. HK10]|uniref:STAS domain-containing protein n=1 Tax=Micromonospora sp. HK10 TaxID=1538294 RepID=UPI000628C334|nr:STAS domain-containing protein [Micromonospora sp. HK10]KKJ93443.1 anti-sigma-factor antagonist [Micromonospora sp. HK10]
MPSQLLIIEVNRLDAARARLRLSGELDFESAPDLLAAAAELRREGYQELVLDFTDVALCDSSGLSALVRIHRAGTTGIHLTALQPQVRQLLTRTGLGELLAAPPGETGQARQAG